MPTQDQVAYELYLKGRLAWNYRTREKLEESLAYFRGALDRDPDFAEAHAAMSAAYVNMSNFGFMSNDEALARAELSADRAIALDSSLVDAFAVRGFVLASRGAYTDAEAAFRKGMALNPSYSWTHHYYALLLTMQNRLDEAEERLRAALALDPVSLPANATLGIIHFMHGRKAEAQAQFERALALHPDFQVTLHYYGAFLAGERRHGDAIRMLERAHKVSPGFPGVRAALAYSYRQTGRATEATRLERELEAAATDDRSRINLGLGYAVLGKADTAFALLQNARWDVPTVFEMRANPLLSAFRADARYPTLLAKLGLR